MGRGDLPEHGGVPADVPAGARNLAAMIGRVRPDLLAKEPFVVLECAWPALTGEGPLAQRAEVRHDAVLPAERVRPAGGGGVTRDLAPVVDGNGHAAVASQGAQVRQNAIVPEDGMVAKVAAARRADDLAAVVDG